MPTTIEFVTGSRTLVQPEIDEMEARMLHWRMNTDPFMQLPGTDGEMIWLNPGLVTQILPGDQTES